MKGLEISIVKFKSLSNVDTFRLDSDYFLKRYLTIQSLVEKKSSNFSLFTDFGLNVNASAFYPSLEPYYNQGDIPFIRVADVDSFIDYENCVKIPSDILNSDHFATLKQIQKGDIVITKGGSIGRIGLINKLTAVTRDLIFIDSSRLSKKDYVFLYFYLNTKFCYDLMIQSSSMTAQPHLTLKLVKNIPLFIATDELKYKVLSLHEQIMAKKTESQSKALEAEKLLLETLNLNWSRLSKEPVNVKTLKRSFLSTGRLDAEYYQPKFDELEAFLLNTKDAVKLGGELKLNKRGTQPLYSETNEGLPVLNSKHIRENKIEFTDIRFGKTEEKGSILTIRKNDVLVNGTGVGTIGRSAVYLKDEPALPDNHVTILRTKDMDPVFLAVQLNSIVGKLQVEKYFKGSSGQIELYPADINEFIIWKAPLEIQKDIRTKIEESEALRTQSENLLSLAKQAVEMAIEQNEAVALAFIKENS